MANIPPTQQLTYADVQRLAGQADRSLRRRAANNRRPGAAFYALLALFVALCAAAFVLPYSRADLSSPPLQSRAVSIAIVVVGTLVSVTFHEWAHAFVALRGGDASVVAKGYLTLDFRRYSDPMLSIGFPLLFLLLGGLPLPGGAVWINQGLLRTNGWRTAVSLAGAAMNLAFGVVLSLLVGSGLLEAHVVLNGALAYLAFIQFGVAILNLLPIPGLDGYAALEPHLPASVRRGLDGVRRFGLLLIIFLAFSGLLGFLWTAAGFLCSLLGVDLGWVGIGATFARLRL